nr:unnamed protein product [Callosobruchus chinensis]
MLHEVQQQQFQRSRSCYETRPLWRFEHAKCVPHPQHSNVSAEAVEPIQCQNVCSEYNSCLNCTQEECIWCQNEGRSLRGQKRVHV